MSTLGPGRACKPLNHKIEKKDGNFDASVVMVTFPRPLVSMATWQREVEELQRPLEVEGALNGVVLRSLLSEAP